MPQAEAKGGVLGLLEGIIIEMDNLYKTAKPSDKGCLQSNSPQIVQPKILEPNSGEKEVAGNTGKVGAKKMKTNSLQDKSDVQKRMKNFKDKIQQKKKQIKKKMNGPQRKVCPEETIYTLGRNYRAWLYIL